MTRLYLNFRLNLFRVAFLALLGPALLGCGGGGDSSPAGINPTGYYEADMASVSDGGSGTIIIDDLQAIVNGSRIMMMSVDKGLLYDGTITDITDNTFTADFTIYADGIANAETASASATITQGSKIEGTLTGSGVGSGTFSLTYAMGNGQSKISRIANTGSNPTWGAIVGGSDSEFGFTVDDEGALVDEVISVGGIFNTCEIFDGTIFPVSGTNVYEVNGRMFTCEDPAVRMNYTGLATTQTSTDITLVFMMASGSYSFNGEFQ